MEFDLEILSDRIQGYDGYIYLGEFNNFLNYTTDKIELLFRIDVLEAIIITLPLKEPENVVAQLESLLSSLHIITEHNFKLFRLYNSNYVICITLIGDNSYVLISNNNLISSLLTSLLW